ncbi:MAG: hypothetical protein ACD_71C00170G0006 [uncultured bacterium (gcode 4)]|uniref:Uncharacterized protein n=1 Tax=uncultured bacterium (gcode 4) TaxID=1234023 RepID=K1Z474_9BACT|nr:MAG: hypothetical protein ACD_71C00170G0006 [uncultured bacterium (gcode 4)]
MQRIEMNTKSLQKHFPDVYRDFFAKNDLVVSGCFSMSWGPGWVWHRSDYVRVKSKIPLKCFIWIKKRKDTYINIDNVIFYDLSKKKFEVCEFEKINWEKEKIILEVSKILKEHSFVWWFDINFLSETTRWHSFWFSWVSWSLIATWIYLLTWQVDKDVLIKDYKNFLTSEVFKKIALLSWKLDLISTYWNTSWHGALNVFFDTKSPTYLYTEKFDQNIEIDDVDNIKRFYQIISEKFKESAITSSIIIDYWIIFSGISTDTKRVEEFKQWHIKKHDSYADFTKNELLEKESDIEKIAFWKYTDDNSIYKSLSETIGIIWIKIIYLFKKILTHWYEQEIVEKFIDTVNQYRYAISLIEKQNSFADDFIFYFNKNKINNEEKLWIVPIYWWKLGWWYLVSTKPDISRGTIEKTLQDLKNIYPNIEIEYCSYFDGEANEGVMVEQFISKWLYSSYVDKNKFLFQSNKWDNYIGDYSEIMEKEQNGLLFDMINNKIYLNGERLTSRDIPSQNTTIEVVTRLLEHIGEELSNKELPNSSYASNKNEMLGKIILPLMKLIEERFGEQLPLVCKWSINDFYIKMWDVNIKIWAIKRI